MTGFVQAVMTTVRAGGLLTEEGLFNPDDCAASRVTLMPGSFFDDGAIPRVSQLMTAGVKPQDTRPVCLSEPLTPRPWHAVRRQGCDVYTMKHIIHDWDDKQSVEILRNTAAAMHPGSRLLLLEVVVPEDNSYNPLKTDFSSYFDLHMLVAVGGAERRPSEFKRILTRAGLELVEVHKGSGPGALMCVIEARLSGA